MGRSIWPRAGSAWGTRHVLPGWGFMCPGPLQSAGASYPLQVTGAASTCLHAGT